MNSSQGAPTKRPLRLHEGITRGNLRTLYGLSFITMALLAFITLNLDWRHHGLGSGSCGPITFPQYQLKTDEFRFAIRLRPFSVDGTGAMALSKSAPGTI